MPLIFPARARQRSPGKERKRLPPRNKLTRYIHRSESGVAMLEFAIIAPMLVILCIGVFDVGRLLLTHLTLTQYVREGTRLASSEMALEPGSYRLFINAGNPECEDVSQDPPNNKPGTPCVDTPAARQDAILKRLYSSMQGTSALRDIKVADLEILAEYSVGADLCRYTIFAKFDGFFQWFDNWNITVTASGPYL